MTEPGRPVPVPPSTRHRPPSIAAVIIAVAAAAAILLGLTTWRYRSAADEQNRLIGRRGTERAVAISALLRDDLARAFIQAGVLHNMARLVTEARLSGNQAAEDALHPFLEGPAGFTGPDVLQVAAVGATGLVMWTNLNWYPPVIDVSERGHFRALRDNPGLDAEIGGEVVLKTTGQQVIQSARAVRGPDGAFRAMTVVSLDAGMLDRLCRDLTLDPDDLVTLVRADGIVVMSHGIAVPGQPFPQWTPGEILPPPGQALAARTSPLDGKQRYIVRRMIPGTDLYVQVGLSQPALAAALNWAGDTVWQQSLLIDFAIVFVALMAAALLLIARRAAAARLRSADLAESEAWFRGVLDNMAAGVAVFDDITDANFPVGYANRALLAMLGMPDGSLAGQRWIDLIHPDDRGIVAGRVARVLQRQDLPATEYRMMRPGDGVIWVRVGSALVPDLLDPGKRRLVTTVRDITAERAQAAALAESEAWFRNVLDLMPDGVLVFDDIGIADLKVSYANRAVLRMLGASPGQVVGQAWRDRVHRDDLPAFDARARAAVAGEALAPSEYRLAAADGRVKWIRTSTSSVVNPSDPARPRLITSLRDVTGEDEQQAELAAARANIERILHTVPGAFYEALYLPSGDYRRTFVSRGLATMLGVPYEETRQPGYLSRYTTVDLAALRAGARERAMRDGFASCEFPIRIHDREIWLRDTLRSVPSDGDERRFVGFVLDITAEHAADTARDRAEAELRRRNWALAAYSRSISVLIHAAGLETMARRICEAIVEEPVYILACFGLPEDGPGKPVRFIGVSGPAAGYMDGLPISWSEDLPEGQGPTGVAIRAGIPQGVQDSHTDSAYTMWRERGDRFGIRSSVTVPTLSNGKALGVLLVYASIPNAFGEEELALFQRLADEIGIAMELEANKTRLEEAQAARRAAEENMHAAVQLGPGVLYRARLTADGPEDVTVFGDEACVTGGLILNDGTPATLETLFRRERLFDALPAGATGGIYSADYAASGSGGTVSWLRNAFRLTASGAAGLEVIGYISEVTREKQEELHRQQVNTLLTMGELATGMAHELNQPLASISFAAQNAELMLEREPADLRAVAAKVVKIVNEAHRASKLVEHMRVFARNEREVPHLVSWHAVLLSSLEILGHKLRGTRVNNLVPPDLPDVLGSAIPMEQVLINLISNAVDAYEQAGIAGAEREVAVWGGMLDGKVVLRVSDRAGGIPPKVLARVFEPFFTTKAPGKGTGLGLALAFGTIAELGGTITVTNENGGATFEIRLAPAGQAGLGEAGAESPVPAEAGLQI